VNPTSDFAGQAAVVTGATTGIGLAAAEAFAAAAPPSTSAAS
jgi:NAD(P)-dependent dehydrogenase (short-subunit alcohol dehydrogenase family)